MTRVKKGVNALKSRKNTLRMVKGYRNGRGTKQKQAFEAISHAGTYAFAHRKDKKGDARRLWNVKISYAVKELGTSYSKVMGGLIKKNILLDRKILSTLALEAPETFKKIVEMAGTEETAKAPKVKVTA
ncbi:MAG: 50S ribosomal protein L20 [Candidatus Zambryskibacteria bacterium]|nr:50S ribosomal protein L20 [Candidatus Zambryskibacteria bacterium]